MNPLLVKLGLRGTYRRVGITDYVQKKDSATGIMKDVKETKKSGVPNDKFTVNGHPVYCRRGQTAYREELKREKKNKKDEKDVEKKKKRVNKEKPSEKYETINKQALAQAEGVAVAGVQAIKNPDADTEDTTDPNIFHESVRAINNRHTAREFCWIYSTNKKWTLVGLQADSSLVRLMEEKTSPVKVEYIGTSVHLTDNKVKLTIKSSLGPQLDDINYWPIITATKAHANDKKNSQVMLRGVNQLEKALGNMSIERNELEFMSPIQWAEGLFDAAAASAFTDELKQMSFKDARDIYVLKGKYAPGLPGPEGCDIICDEIACPKNIANGYAYLKQIWVRDRLPLDATTMSDHVKNEVENVQGVIAKAHAALVEAQLEKRPNADTITAARTDLDAVLAKHNILEKDYGYGVLGIIERGAFGPGASSGAQGYENGFFAGWGWKTVLTSLVVAITFWSAAYTVKHLSAVWKGISNAMSLILCFYVGDYYILYNPEKAISNTIMVPITLTSVVIVIAILMFALNAAPKKEKKGKEGGEEADKDNSKDAEGSEVEGKDRSGSRKSSKTRSRASTHKSNLRGAPTSSPPPEREQPTTTKLHNSVSLAGAMSASGTSCASSCSDRSSPRDASGSPSSTSPDSGRYNHAAGTTAFAVAVGLNPNASASASSGANSSARASGTVARLELAASMESVVEADLELDPSASVTSATSVAREKELFRQQLHEDALQGSAGAREVLSQRRRTNTAASAQSGPSEGSHTHTNTYVVPDEE